MGDQVHNQLMLLPAVPTAIELRASGDPASLARVSSDWLQGLLERRYVREEWVHRRTVYAHRYVVAGTGEPLCEAFDYRSAPAGLGSGTSRVAIGELGPPDRVVEVEVER